jgi:hypothetical protein
LYIFFSLRTSCRSLSRSLSALYSPTPCPTAVNWL